MLLSSRTGTHPRIAANKTGHRTRRTWSVTHVPPGGFRVHLSGCRASGKLPYSVACALLDTLRHNSDVPPILGLLRRDRAAVHLWSFRRETNGNADNCEDLVTGRLRAAASPWAAAIHPTEALHPRRPCTPKRSLSSQGVCQSRNDLAASCDSLRATAFYHKPAVMTSNVGDVKRNRRASSTASRSWPTT